MFTVSRGILIVIWLAGLFLFLTLLVLDLFWWGRDFVPGGIYCQGIEFGKCPDTVLLFNETKFLVGLIPAVSVLILLVLYTRSWRRHHL